MEIQEFIKKIDEVLELKRILEEKANSIYCNVGTGKSVIIEHEELLLLAKEKLLSIDVEPVKNLTFPFDCYIRVSVEYNGVELVAFFSERNYAIFKERGLLP